MKTTGFTLPLLLALILWPATSPDLAPPSTSKAVQAKDWSKLLVKIDTMIPMRDGARLHTEIYVPRNATGPLPFIMERTPYGLRPDAKGYSGKLNSYPELVQDGYIVVYQDLRGRFRSEGKYQTLRPPRKDPDGIDETTDTYDTIEWLINNVPNNNGRVGFLGISYGGFTTMRALYEPHPALKATSPQATCADMFIGDDWHHNGAFRLDYSFRWVAGMERGTGRNRFVFDQEDLYEWFLDLGPLSNVNKKIFHGEVPSWNYFVEHPNMDWYWETEMCGVLPFVGDGSVPALHVLGWFDAEDFYGPLKVYQKLERIDEQGTNYLVIGPWYHGSWAAQPEGRQLLDIDFGSPTSKFYRETVQVPWFAYWLKDEGSLDRPEALAFQTGANIWEHFDRWPPTDRTVDKNIYLHSDGRMLFDAPRDADTYDSYVSDPHSPVPYRHRPIRGSAGWPTWQLQDQRFVHRRPDVLSWESEPLEEAVSISGDIIAHLFASTTGTAADWVVKLIDVYPDDFESRELRGYQLMVAGEVFRARYRNSYREPEPVVPNEVTEYTISLRDRSHKFERGHRIMVQVQSTWFPIIDRNPQKYVPSIFEAVEGDFEKATQRIYRSRRYPSHITLPVRID